MSEQYDFFTIGQRHAQDSIAEIRRLAEEYEREYGKEARIDFETGIVSEMSQYILMSEVEIKNGGVSMHGTTNYGKRNMRNNSYFDRNGTSSQYVFTPTGPKYNDPESSHKKK